MERNVGPILSNLYLDALGPRQIHRRSLLYDTKYQRSSSQASTSTRSTRHFANPVTVDIYPPGYGRVAAFEDCDPSFQICRKFGQLHIRLLLHLQDEVQELEEELESLDNWEFSSGDPVMLRTRRIDYDRPNAPRKALLTKIAAKLAEYGEAYPLCLWVIADLLADEMLLRLQKKNEIRKATKRNQNSLYNAIRISKSMMSGETLWIRNRDDLLALAKDAEHGWFNGILEDTLRRLSSRITLVGIHVSVLIPPVSHPGLDWALYHAA